MRPWCEDHVARVNAMTDLLLGPLHDRHAAQGATFAEFGGWNMPVSYAGTVGEHTATRAAVGLFDVSHLGKALVRGPERQPSSTRVLPMISTRLGSGKAQYTLCCTETGGVIDDLIAYYVSDDEIFLVPNAANTSAVVAALQEQAPEDRRHQSASRLRGACGAGAQVRGRAATAGSANGYGVHGLRRRHARRSARAGVPYRLHRRARLRAVAVLGRRRCRVRCPAARDHRGGWAARRSGSA